MRQSHKKSPAFLVCRNVQEASMANSVDPDQTLGAVCSGSTLFASILNLSVILGNYLRQTTFSDAFFIGAFRVKRIQLPYQLHVAFLS